ncbi:MAG: DUF11 domain-containing protein, partial [Pseudomonadales bacterium]|nr:DUF11 domain-containing protein [Pseudomonadales bacterium]
NTNTFVTSRDTVCGLGSQFPNDGVNDRKTYLRSIPYALYKSPGGVLSRRTLWSSSGKTSIGANQNDQFLAPVMYDNTVYHAGGGTTDLANEAGVYAFKDTSSAIIELTTIANQWPTAGGGDGYVNLAPNTMWSPAVNGNVVVTYTASLAQDSFEETSLAELNVIDRSTGEVTSTITLGSLEYVPPISGAIASLYAAPVLVDSDTVLVINNGHLINIGLSSKDVNWAIDDEFYGQPAVGKGVIYALTESDASCGAANATCLIARSTSGGNPLEDSAQDEWRWVAPSSATIYSPFVVTDSHAFVSTSDGNTYAINLSTGKSNSDRIDGTYNSVGALSFAFRTLYIAGSFYTGWSYRPIVEMNNSAAVVDAEKSFIRAIQFDLDTSIAADMGVTITSDVDTVRIEENITYTVTVTNNGGISVGSATLTGLLPASLSVVTLSDGCTESNQQISCSLGGLASSASTIVTIVATPTAISSLNFTVEAGSEKIDNADGNDEATDVAESIAALETSHDLASTITASSSNVEVGDSVSYTITITNSGTDRAASVLATMTLSAGTVTSLSASVGSCSITTITCELDAITASASVTITLVMTVSAEGTLSTTATASSSSSSATDSNSSNNGSAHSLSVSASSTTTTTTTTTTSLLPDGGGSGGSLGLMIFCMLSGLILFRRKG